MSLMHLVKLYLSVDLFLITDLFVPISPIPEGKIVEHSEKENIVEHRVWNIEHGT